MRTLLIFAVLLATGVSRAADLAAEASSSNDIEISVSLDPAGQSGSASAIVRIHASRETVWSLITSCPESLRMVPGLEICDVLETAQDQSWQRIRHVMNYSWYVPKVTYVIRATYDPPAKVSIERISGDLRTLKGSWELKSDGDYTIAHYMVDLAPGFWVPNWIVKTALRRDLPKMLRALRSRAEAAPSRKP
ncbi:MAG TPA: SRPBCC family protein [Steroidobacteraceae bacterium]|nr:SRPBCC family protein [Steroidobacteraceae bacterium]